LAIQQQIEERRLAREAEREASEKAAKDQKAKQEQERKNRESRPKKEENVPSGSWRRAPGSEPASKPAAFTRRDSAKKDGFTAFSKGPRKSVTEDQPAPSKQVKKPANAFDILAQVSLFNFIYILG
jgi:hypothetical protein